MIVGIRCGGATSSLIHATLAAFVDVCADFYRENPLAPRVDVAPVLYRPDAPSEVVVFLAPDLWAWNQPLSCGSAAGAFAGWQRSRGQLWSVRRQLRDATRGVWHAIATDATAGQVWDPMKELRR